MNRRKLCIAICLGTYIPGKTTLWLCLSSCSFTDISSSAARADEDHDVLTAAAVINREIRINNVASDTIVPTKSDIMPLSPPPRNDREKEDRIQALREEIDALKRRRNELTSQIGYLMDELTMMEDMVVVSSDSDMDQQHM